VTGLDLPLQGPVATADEPIMQGEGHEQRHTDQLQCLRASVHVAGLPDALELRRATADLERNPQAELTPQAVVWVAVAREAHVNRRCVGSGGGDPEAEWRERVKTCRAALAAAGPCPPGLTPPNLTPLGDDEVVAGRRRQQAHHDRLAAVKAERAAAKRKTPGRWLLALAGSVVGAVAGSLLSPLVMAIVGAGPATPYGSAQPLNIFESWWIWLGCVGVGGWFGFQLGAGDP
jgi:hypothetical protein